MLANARLMTAEEIEQETGLKKELIWHLGRIGVLPRVKVGKRGVRYRETDILEFIERGGIVDDRMQPTNSTPNAKTHEHLRKISNGKT